MAKPTTSIQKMPLVSIVILNWNGLDDTLKCLDSVKELKYENYEVIVIDNGSEGSLKPLEKRVGKNIQLVKNAVNKGFAGGEVSALPYCNGEYVLLLNNDATIDKHAITRAVETFSLDEKIAVVGSRSYSVDEDSEVTHGFHSFQRVDPITAEVATYKTDDAKNVDWPTVSGSGVMIKRSAIDTVGYFDERFFAYYEETDLFARYLRAGLRVVYNPAFIIWHKDGASTKDKRFMYYYLMLKNQFLFAYKNFDKSYLHQFKKTYFRNFRRSLWMCLKDRSSTEAIHKARVRSTIWNLVNIFGTIKSRRSTLSINHAFSYSTILVEEQPLTMSIIIDATTYETNDSIRALDYVLSLTTKPSEIIIVTKKALSVPKHSRLVTIQNIVDKGIFTLTASDFGFMSSNTDLLMFLTPSNILSSDPVWFSENLLSIYRESLASEAAVVINKDFIITPKSDLQFANGSSAPILALRKADLVNYLVISENVHSLTNQSLGDYINWSVLECKPIARISGLENLTLTIEVPESSYPILNSPFKWHIKKLIRTLHLSRILSKLRKVIKNKASQDELSSNDPSNYYVPLDITDKEAEDTPIFINTRDRVEPLRELLDWLNKAGHKNIALIDNDSTYPELIDLFDSTPLQVVTLGRNGMHKAPWESFAIRFMSKGLPYIVTDPDVVPTDKTPKNIVKYFYSVLNKYPKFNKVGSALKIDDLPDYYQMKQSVIDWESRFWNDSLLLSKDIYSADLDTTFALYRGKTWWFLSPSIRVSGKYSLRHEPWYQDLDNPTNDMMYYRTRASQEVSTWTKGKLPKHHLRALKKEGLL
jgi:hypothetical protein